MSDDERSESGSSSDGSETLQTTGLIATREKRSTAGNLYASLLRDHLDDDEIRKELLEEDEEDAADYEGSERDDEDDALESSSDEDDAGPPREGAEDLEGEKALKREERAEIRKKRKVQDARLKLPAWQKKNKRVKLADDVKTEDGAADKPKKKSERSNWLPTPADAPTRQSGRALAVANREVTHANLKQSYERSEKQRRVMQNAAEREQTKKRMDDMSQKDRLEYCEKIAKQTDKEFGRWERDEAERQRLRDEALAAKRNKGFDVPFVRYWSGSVLWEGDRIKVRRVEHGSKKVDEIKDEPKQPAGGSVEAATTGIVDLTATRGREGTESLAQPATPSQTPRIGSQVTATAPPVPIAPTSNSASPTHLVQPTLPATSSIPPPVPWLQGIHDYASQPQPTQPNQQAAATQTNNYAPSTTAPPHVPPQQLSCSVPQTVQPSSYAQPPPHTYAGWPPGTQTFPIHLPPPTPPPPLIREQAQRSLIILSQFENLDINTTKRSKTASTLDPTPTASTLLPSTYPSFNADETRYLTAKYTKRNTVMPAPPEKPHCAILSNKEARFRDPKTGLAYYDLHTYKIIQRVLAGGCQWSGLLGAWVGPAYGVMGRPAKGVPDGFAGPSGVKAEGRD